ncbi:MAG: hypothetical protein G01um101425_93 [Candidatus Peregrinibacteria bacterium Gr01-1014_25]|nr:MAG: hypothetical protein G01um101425_93 [Candidatus Peregrinibacteria bacterium Gr01-1014_25]
MRLIVCSTGIPHRHFHPRLSASLMTLYSYIEESKRSGVQILHLMILDRKNFDEELLQRYRVEQEDDRLTTLVWQTPSYLQPRRGVFDPIRPLPLPEEYRRRLREFQPDAVFCLDAYAAGALKDLKVAPIFVQVHDPKFQTMWYHALYALRENPFRPLQPLVDMAKALRWRRYYREALSHADRVVTVATSGADALVRMGIPAQLFPMLWIGVPGADTSMPTHLPSKPTFVFQGNLSGLGSRAALHYLLNRAFPVIRQHWGRNGFEILLCGSRSLPAWVAERIGDMPEIRFLGFVEDIAALLRGCHAVLAPIDVPIGNRTRILTAMALGVPVVTHVSIASANPHLVDGKTCLIADAPEEFVSKMIQAFHRGPAIEAIIRNAQQTYIDTFSPPAATKALLDALRVMRRAS